MTIHATDIVQMEEYAQFTISRNQFAPVLENGKDLHVVILRHVQRSVASAKVEAQ